MPDSPEPLFPLPDRPAATPTDTSYPSLSASAPSTGNPATPRKYLYAAAGLVVVAVLVAAGVYGTTRSSDDVQMDTAARPAANASGGEAPNNVVGTCTSAPVASVDDARLSASGLVLDVTAAGGCSVDSVVSSSSVRINVVDGPTNVAAGVFDFSSDPALLTGDGHSRLTLTFPLGTFWMVPSTLSSSTSVEIDPGSNDSSNASASEEVSLSASTAAPPTSGDAEMAAAEALRAISDSDRTVVASSLADRWIPQISSKKPGLVTEGKTWTNADILLEHLQMRIRYPSAHLIWSGSWSTFSSPDWWVTAVGETYPTGESANTWCVANNFDRDHCYAKLVSSVRPVDGSTVLQK
ncbi:hypothetical protein [Rhodococcus sovatensis]|uniref:Uncharacterized protein n=1 Tax=Rhodococcus sovatensis TaxID=1805840 RepID=A0ABZ2PPI8_9NOCA